MQKGLSIVISAPSGSGKGTIIPYVMKKLPDTVFSVSCTTRSPRPGERDGVEYFFISREEFEEKIRKGEMLEYNEYVGNLYGTPRSFVEEKTKNGTSVLFDVDVNGAVNIKKALDDVILIMLLPPSYSVLSERLKNRKTDSPEVIEKRLEKAIVELGYFSEFNYLVINETGKPEAAADRIIEIIDAEKSKISRNTAYPEYFKNN